MQTTRSESYSTSDKGYLAYIGKKPKESAARKPLVFTGLLEAVGKRAPKIEKILSNLTGQLTTTEAMVPMFNPLIYFEYSTVVTAPSNLKAICIFFFSSVFIEILRLIKEAVMSNVHKRTDSRSLTSAIVRAAGMLHYLCQ